MPNRAHVTRSAERCEDLLLWDERRKVERIPPMISAIDSGLTASTSPSRRAFCSTLAVQFTGASATGLVDHNLTQETLTSDGERITVTLLLETRRHGPRRHGGRDRADQVRAQR